MSRSDGRVLLVRKKATESFMQPGGKIETGEHPQDALRRELSEELGIDIDPSEMTYVGRYTAPAANEPGRQVDAEFSASSLRIRSLREPRSRRFSGSIRPRPELSNSRL
ncbi:NUDIX hydrolase [Bradyrhizobium diazoefficiens]|uniref:NUDIX hydrolase n=1 Tax=Bradyrhizobium diazoefficiens TaxID=1355477 RepID=UPI0034E3C468